MTTKKLVLLFMTCYFLGMPLSLWARGGGGCFVPGTPIFTSQTTSLPIEELKEGDPILGWSDDKLVLSQVARLIEQEVSEIIQVRVDDQTFWTTWDHPFFSGSDYYPLAHFHPGDGLYRWNGQALISRPFHIVSKKQGRFKVYNLAVKGPHNFFAAGILVHNKGGGCFPPGTQVATPRGNTNIEALKVGDRVWGDRGPGIEEVGVTQVFQTYDVILEILTDQGRLSTTSEHPLGLWGGDFCAAGELRPGQLLKYWHHDRFVPAKILSLTVHQDTVPVFNLEVSGNHTFLADSFLVHNKGGGGGHGGGGGGGHGGFSFVGSGSPGGSDENPHFWVDIIFVVLVLVLVIVGLYYLAHANETPVRKKETPLTFLIDEVFFSQDKIRERAKSVSPYFHELAAILPGLELPELKKTVREVFILLQRCWENRDYLPLQRYLTDGLYKKHGRLIEGLIKKHEINRIENLKVTNLALIRVVWGAKDKRLSWIISAEAKDFYRDDRSQRFLRGDWRIEPFQEIWIFQYDQGVWKLSDIEQVKETRELRLPCGVKPVPLGASFSSGEVQEEQRFLDWAGEMFILWYTSLDSHHLAEDLKACLTEVVQVEWERQSLRQRLRDKDFLFSNFCIRYQKLKSVARISGNIQKFTVGWEAQYFNNRERWVRFHSTWNFELKNGKWMVVSIG